ncbi:DUF924 family protein [uncultured Psychrobacter sp.]|uniref:DUF924 family protein n=1 Tax=uncultured Psychrobacter sp. TaxID=259303 RepID=UPI003457D2C7
MSLSTDYTSSSKTRAAHPLETTDINLDALHPDARAVLDFWFDKDNEPYWFEKNDNFDQQIYDKFGKIWRAAKRGECVVWRYNDRQADFDDSVVNSAGRLAEIIVLDQFSRNLCRDQAQAFAQDGMALVLAQEAIKQPQFDNLPMEWRRFTIMPFMHSESLMIHERYLPLFEQLNDAQTLDFEHRHLDIIKQFGRYPHRNDALDRESTDEEEAFLQQPNSSF